jgi:hypothetical protein
MQSRTGCGRREIRHGRDRDDQWDQVSGCKTGREVAVRRKKSTVREGVTASGSAVETLVALAATDTSAARGIDTAFRKRASNVNVQDAGQQRREHTRHRRGFFFDGDHRASDD